jgi:high-affinity nickel-transport protein
MTTPVSKTRLRTGFSNINLNNVGFVIVGLFVLTWVVALSYWRLAKVEDRWAGPHLEPETS